MKKLLSILLLFVCQLAHSQTVPQGINYQAVALDQRGQPIPGIDIVGRPIDDAEIGVRIAILENSPTGNILYQEEHEVLTDLYGMFNLVIGQGLQVSVDPFSSINWQGDKFLQVELSIENDGEFVLSAVQQLMSVPYAFLAENAMVAQTAVDVDDADADPSNELQSLSVSGDSLTLSNGNTVQLPAIDDADADPNNEIQVLSISNDTLYLSNGGFAVLPVDQVNDADSDPSNEIQSLTKSGSTISLTNGGSVTVFDGDYNNLSNTPAIPTKTSDLTNDSGFLTTEVDGSTTNELQVLSLSNDTIYLTSGGYVVLPAGFDGDYNNLTNKPVIPSKTSDLTNDSGFITAEVDGSATNELQLLSMSNDTLYLTDGGFVVLPSGFDGDYNSLTNTPTIPSKTSDLTNDSGFITTEQDSSVTNELQTLSISNDTLFLSNGGFVKLPNSAGGISDSNVGKVLFVSQTFSSSRTSNGSTYDTIKKINLEANILYELEMLLAASTMRATCGASSSVIVLDENYNSIPFESLEGNVHSVGNCNGSENSSNHYNLYFTPASSGTYSFIFRFTVSGYNNYQNQGGNGGSARILLRSIISSNISNGIVSADQDSTNELQTLSISNDTIFLTDGGFVKLPSSSQGNSSGNGLLLDSVFTNNNTLWPGYSGSIVSPYNEFWNSFSFNQEYVSDTIVTDALEYVVLEFEGTLDDNGFFRVYDFDNNILYEKRQSPNGTTELQGKVTSSNGIIFWTFDNVFHLRSSGRGTEAKIDNISISYYSKSSGNISSSASQSSSTTTISASAQNNFSGTYLQSHGLISSGPGDSLEWVVPNGIFEIQIIQFGSNGGASGQYCVNLTTGCSWSCSNGQGGDGMDVTFKFNVNSGDTIKIYNGIDGEDKPNGIKAGGTVGNDGSISQIMINNQLLVYSIGGFGGIRGTAPCFSCAPGCGTKGQNGRTFLYGNETQGINASSINNNFSGGLNNYGLVEFEASTNLSVRNLSGLSSKTFIAY